MSLLANKVGHIIVCLNKETKKRLRLFPPPSSIVLMWFCPCSYHWSKMSVSTNTQLSFFQEIMRKEWLFKLVGKETFTVGEAKTKATINIDAVSGFAYEYTLEINGKSLKKYLENRSKTTNTWVLTLDGADCRIVLGRLFSYSILCLFNCIYFYLVVLWYSQKNPDPPWVSAWKPNYKLSI